MIIYNSDSPEMTVSLGAKIADVILSSGNEHAFIALYGDLGAGKTELVRGIVSVLSPGSHVKSPSYTIVNEYLRGTVPVYHFDFYRIADVSELDSIGFDDYLFGGICIAEWSEKLGNQLPSYAITVRIEKVTDTRRIITVENFDAEDISDVDTGI